MFINKAQTIYRTRLLGARSRPLAIAFFALCIELGIVIPTGCAVAGERERSLFLKEYPAALARYEEVFSKIRASGLLRVHKKKSGSEWGYSADIAMSGPSKKVVLVASEGGRKVVHCDGNRGTFSLNGQGSRYAMTRLGKAPNRSDAGILFDGMAGQFIKVPFAIYGEPFSDCLSNPAFGVDSAEYVTQGGIELMRVKYHSMTQNNNKFAGILDVVPDLAWAATRHEVLSGGSSVVYDAQYEGVFKDCSIPKRVVASISGQTMTFDFHEVLFDQNISDDEFSLPFYGLPDLTVPVDRPADFSSYALYGLGALFLAAAFVLRRNLGKPSASDKRISSRVS